jgi:hypothetical protein
MASRKGSSNKNKDFLNSRLQAMYGKDFDPIMKMAEQAVRIHNQTSDVSDIDDLKSSIDAWDKIAQYTTPKLKALEVSGDGDNGEIIIKTISYASNTTK